MNTVKTPWPHAIDIDDIDEITKRLNQLQGVAALFRDLDVDCINQDELCGAAWILNDVVDGLDETIQHVLKRGRADEKVA